MLFQTDLLPAIWPWAMLMVCLILLWSGHRRAGWSVFAVWLMAAFIAGSLGLPALIAILGGLALARALPGLRGPAGLAGHVALVLWSVAMAAHLVPGFGNLPVLDQVRSGPLSAPYSLYLNLDKPIVFLALALAWPGMLSRNAPVQRIPMFLAILFCAALLPLAVATGALAPEPALPAWLGLFLIANLLQTCLVEEAFFRGYLQNLLVNRFGPAAGIAAASLLFGLAHIGGGWAVTLFATLLGLACGLGLRFGGRLWIPVLMHFAFNVAHLTLLTYPAPA
jgi:membrane protease YdiL (CAAX protease family)